MVLVPPGVLSAGSDEDGKGGGPGRKVAVPGFLMDRHEVTNGQFARFVGETGYRTESEEEGGGWNIEKTRSVVGVVGTSRGGLHEVVEESDGPRWTEGFDWRHPGGPGSSVEGTDLLPAAFVSWRDAAAYAAWAGRRLPTEAEFERALRGGRDGASFPWGSDAVVPAGAGNYADATARRFRLGWNWAMRIYDDGWERASTAGSFGPNPLGLFDVSGNLWEWCTGSRGGDGGGPAAPGGPSGENSARPALRGGGWDSGIQEVRCAYRGGDGDDYTRGRLVGVQTGFRCALSPR